MGNSNFDINSLLNFKPSKYLCKNCFGLIKQIKLNDEYTEAKCPVCDIEYIPTEDYDIYQTENYLKAMNYNLEYEDLLNHSKKLAEIAIKIKKYLNINSNQKKNNYFNYNPMRGLFNLLNSAKHFVHFTSYGMSHQFLGAFKMLSERIPVRGIISNVSSGFEHEIKKCNKESPNINIKYFKSNNGKNIDFSAHQKLVIIDGLVALKGTANLTLSGYRKAAQARDILEVLTNIKEINNLNNRYFSLTWKEFAENDNIIMDKFDVPF